VKYIESGANMVKTKTYAEYLEVLERFDIPVEDRTSRERLQEALQTQLGKFAPRDITPFWETVQWQFEELAPRGVKPVTVKYPWGETLRFAIKGYRGLFGAERMSEITGITW
jgi:hypothetical protein